MPKIIKLAGVKIDTRARALDLGCGDGRSAGWAAAQGMQVTAVDYSEQRINLARRRHPDVTFIPSDIYKFLATTDGRFDVIFLFEVLEHLEDPCRVIRSAQARLTTKGHVLATVPIQLPAKQHLSVFKNADDAKLRLAAENVSLLQNGRYRHAVLTWSAVDDIRAAATTNEVNSEPG